MREAARTELDYRGSKHAERDLASHSQPPSPRPSPGGRGRRQPCPSSARSRPFPTVPPAGSWKGPAPHRHVPQHRRRRHQPTGTREPLWFVLPIVPAIKKFVAADASHASPSGNDARSANIARASLHSHAARPSTTRSRPHPQTGQAPPVRPRLRMPNPTLRSRRPANRKPAVPRAKPGNAPPQSRSTTARPPTAAPKLDTGPLEAQRPRSRE